MIAYYNGCFMKYEDVSIPLTDRSIYFGDAVYDAIMSIEGRLYLGDRHVKRLVENAKKLQIPCPYSEAELTDLIKQVVRINGCSELFIYIQLSRTDKKRSHAYSEDCGSSLLITAKKQPLPDFDMPLSVGLDIDVRYLLCNIKTVNLLPAVIAASEGARLGYDEVILHRSGTVTEGTRSNVLIMKNGKLKTHPNGRMILPGITKERLIELALKEGVETVEEAFDIEELMDADEVLISGTSRLLARVGKINGKDAFLKDERTAKKLYSLLFSDFMSKLPNINC